MSPKELKTFVYVTILVTVVALAVLVWLFDGMQVGPQTLKRVPTAVTATLFFWVFFSQWGWKWWPLNLIFNRPHLGGTWVGHLESNWQRGSTSPGPLIPIVFIIRQTLFSVVIRSFTNDRDGLSDVAKVVVKEEVEVTYLSYVYSLREEFRAGQGNQQGAAELRVSGKRRELRGQYWTNMNTSGRVLLRRCSNQVVHSFNDACEKWPSDTWPKFEA
jgi:predicted pore-forming effector associated with SMODS systems